MSETSIWKWGITTLALAIIALVGLGFQNARLMESTAGPDVEPSATGGSSAVAPDAKVFRAKIRPLGDSGVKGTATFRIQGDKLSVNLNAQGHTPDAQHPQHIHMNAECPNFGGILLALEPFPTPTNQGGAIHYKETFSADAVSDLGNRTVVLHAGSGAPVACGNINPAN